MVRRKESELKLPRPPSSGTINGEAWLINPGDEADADWAGRWYFGTVKVKRREYRENPPRPLRLDRIKDAEVFSTDDVAYLAGCKAVTVLRHVADGKLKRAHSRRKGVRAPYRDRGFFFLGKEIKRWRSENKIQVGRPKKEREK